MHNRSHKKYGHRRQISRQLIKRQLMQELYPIPRQHKLISRSKARTQIDHKFTKTLQFLQYNQTETLLLQRFQEKVQSELTLNQVALNIIFSQLTVDKRILDLSTKLIVGRNYKERNQISIKFQLKGLSATASKEIKQIIELLFFFSFLKENKTQYKSLLRQFEERKIAQIVSSLNYKHSVVLTSKITSVICMVYIKYQEMNRFIKLAQTSINLREKFQHEYGLIRSFSINGQYASATFFFRLKYLEYQLRNQCDSYQLMLQIQKAINKMNEYPQSSLIQNNIRQIFFNEINKLKAKVSAKVEQDYYRSAIPIPQQSKQNKTKQALKLYKRRRSLTNLKHKSSTCQDQNLIQSISQLKQNEKEGNPAKKKQEKNAREIYIAEKTIKKNVSVFQKTELNSKLKKTGKTTKQSFNSSKGFLTGQMQTKEVLANNYTFQANLLMNYGCLFKKDETAEVQSKKKDKIVQIYQTFAKQNNIIRDIPTRNLQRELYQIYCIKLGTKVNVREMFKKEIIDFTAGLSDNTLEFNKILSLKKCLCLEFIKIWIGQLYRCKIELQVTGTECTVQATLNDNNYKLLLHRGENVLCERYLTIWPTVRYLISKKIATISAFSECQKELMAKKMGENQVINLCSGFYEQKFGIISKQQIQQINICLDNLVKLILVIIHYYQKQDKQDKQAWKEQQHKPDNPDKHDKHDNKEKKGHKRRKIKQTKPEYRIDQVKQELNESRDAQKSQDHQDKVGRKAFKTKKNTKTDKDQKDGQKGKIQLNKQYKYRIASDRVKDGEILKLNLITEIYLNQMTEIHIFSFILSSKYGYFNVDGYSPRDRLLISINNRSDLQIKLKITDFKKEQFEQSDRFVLGWQQLDSVGVCYDSFLNFVRFKCAKMRLNRYFLNNLMTFIAKRLFVKFHPILKTDVFYKTTTNAQYLQNYRAKRHLQKQANYITHNSQSILKIVQNDDYVDASLRKEQQPATFTLQNDFTNKPRLKAKSNVLRHKDKTQQAEKIWQQQRIIKGRYFLTRIMLKNVNEIEFEAEYILIDRITQHKYSFLINHLDVKQVLEQQSNYEISKSLLFYSSKIMYNSSQDNILNDTHFRKAQLIQLLNNFDFYYNHHIKKIFINCQNGNYCHSFKKRYRRSFQEIKRRGKFLDQIEKQPFLTKSVLNCKFRITKVLKIDNRYIFLTIKRNFIQGRFFWEIILELQRKHTQMVCLIQEKRVMEWLFQSKIFIKNPNKSITQSRFRQQSLSKKKINSKQNCFLTLQNLHPNSKSNDKYQDTADYKPRILKLFQMGEIQVQKENIGDYKVYVKHEQLNFRQRIIQEYDNQKSRIYFVWFDGQWLEVEMLLVQPLDSSRKSQKIQQTVLKDFVPYVLGKIQFFNAKRFYQMQNKDLDEGDDYEKRICLFYFQWCKHQRIKYQSQTNQVYT